MREFIADVPAAKTLVRLGLPACAVTAFLTMSGSGLTQFTALAASVIAYGIVGKRKVYPFGRIAKPTGSETAQGRNVEIVSVRLKRRNDSLRGVAVVWFMLLLLMAGLSGFTPISPGYYFAFERITNISAAALMLSSIFGQSVGVFATRYLTMGLRAIDSAFLVLFSLFFSLTGSACLYWLALYYKENAGSRRPSR